MLAIAVCACSCRSSKQTQQQPQLTEQPGRVDGITETPTLPENTHFDWSASTVIYRADPAYAQNVPVGVTPSGSAVIYVPSPSDAAAAPVPLADGYWLATIPVGKQTVFTDYTFENYLRFAASPSPSEVLKHVIKDARPASIVRLPVATADTAVINGLIRQGLPGCKVID